jgi:hypothetical protein
MIARKIGLVSALFTSHQLLFVDLLTLLHIFVPFTYPHSNLYLTLATKTSIRRYHSAFNHSSSLNSINYNRSQFI